MASSSSKTVTDLLRVAAGLQKVASAVATQATKEGSHVAASASRHGMDLMNNMQTVVKAHVPNVNVNNSTIAATSTNTSTTRGRMMNDKQEVLENSAAVQDMKNNVNSMNQISREQSSGPSSIPFVETDQEELSSKTLKASDDDGILLEKSIDISKDRNLYQETINSTAIAPPTTTTLKEGKAVPSTRIGRAFGFASLGVGLAAGTAVELASRVVGLSSSSTNNNNTNDKTYSPMTSDANADRLAQTLCRMRGAALKLGQMLSIQDETLLPPPMARALEQVRKGADAMPYHQLDGQMTKELDGTDWKEEWFVKFEDLPFAAASIGQVHRATIQLDETTNQVVKTASLDNHDDGDDDGDDDDSKQIIQKEVAVKVQYPGVANSIESDLANLSMLVTMTGMAPPGLFIERVIEVGRDELKVECDYKRELNNQRRMKEFVESDDELVKARFVVPSVIEDLSTEELLVTEFCPGGTIDKVAFLEQEERNRIGRNIMRLTMKELFTWRFMQTDPNWGNFLYDVGTKTTYLIDFGSAREYDKSFVDGYLRIVWASAERDTETLMEQSKLMGFLTGEENDIMLEAHKMSGYTIGDPFASHQEYDFGSSGITGRISEYGSAFLQHRLTPPPEEVYTLHRKLAGAYNLCIKLNAKIQCRDLLEEILENHVFEDGQDHPLQKSI